MKVTISIEQLNEYLALPADQLKAKLQALRDREAKLQAASKSEKPPSSASNSSTNT
jgi:hypothetical protein